MSKREEIETRVEQLLLPILDGFAFDLWDVGYVKEGKEMFLRVFIDKEGGITIDDCVSVSRKLSDLLDEDDFIGEPYTLEVSSPGLGRRLVKDREFSRSIGRDVDVKFYKSVDGTKETTGRLVAFDKDSITIAANGKEERCYNRSEIASVKLSLDL
ncbi:MAG: ribosome maturation factor RimP [Lachnospiraceae bacterium]|nr:ribosome maturation factor RimP [Lachnospiraceae bacterium]